MSLRSYLRTPTARAVADLRADIDQLVAAVRRLEAAQRKDAEQLKKLRKALGAQAAATTKLLTGVDRSLVSLDASTRAQAGGARAALQVLKALEVSRTTDAKWRKIFSNQLSALIRHVCLPLDRLRPPYALTARRFRLRSQNEEDGVLLALLEQPAGAGRGSSRSARASRAATPPAWRTSAAGRA